MNGTTEKYPFLVDGGLEVRRHPIEEITEGNHLDIVVQMVVLNILVISLIGIANSVILG